LEKGSHEEIWKAFNSLSATVSQLNVDLSGKVNSMEIGVIKEIARRPPPWVTSVLMVMTAIIAVLGTLLSTLSTH